MAIVSYQVARCEEARFGKQGVGPDGGTVVKGRQQLVLFFSFFFFFIWRKPTSLLVMSPTMLPLDITINNALPVEKTGRDDDFGTSSDPRFYSSVNIHVR